MKAATASTCLSVALLMAVLSVPACAADDDWGGLDWRWDALHAGPGVRHHHRRYYRAPQPEARYYRAPDYVDEGRHVEIDVRREERHCLEHHEEVVSTEHAENENAMVSAHKLWSARVQWYWGSRWMDWDNAVDKKEVCDQSNAMDTLTGRLIDNAQKMIGNDGRNVRCVIRAIPCAASLEKAEEEKRP